MIANRNINDGVFHVKFDNLQIVRVSDSPPYSGDYTVTPDTNGAVLRVKGMLMADDIVIEPIPEYEVSNSGGGITKIIGVKQNG